MRRIISAVLAVLALGVAPQGARGETAFDPARFEPLFDTLSPCQLFNLSAAGYLRVSPSRFMRDRWTPGTLEALASDARQRPSFKIELRSTVHLQIAHASSYQAATVFDALAAFMRAEQIEALPRAKLIAAADIAYRRKLRDGGFIDCFILKWGNRYPDIFAQPMRESTWMAIEALFAPDAPTAFPESAAEQALMAEGRLTKDEIRELRAIRIAAYLFENEFATLRNDRGGFSGNMDDTPFVCTDEATTHWFLLERLQRQGLLTHFSTQDQRFVHRSPNLILPSDHFGVLLRNLRTGAYFVLDSWVEDGGLPPHISTIDDWFNKHERRSVASIGDATLDKALEDGRVTHRNRDGLLTALQAHLARFAPADQTPRLDGRPPTCGHHWCSRTPDEALREAW